MNLQISNDRLASQSQPENLKFERADWTSFRTVKRPEYRRASYAGWF